MDPYGEIRRIDDLGRVVIPMGIRRLLGLVEGTPLNIVHTDEEIVITRYKEPSMSEEIKRIEDRINQGYDRLEPEDISTIKEYLAKVKMILALSE